MKAEYPRRQPCNDESKPEYSTRQSCIDELKQPDSYSRRQSCIDEFQPDYSRQPSEMDALETLSQVSMDKLRQSEEKAACLVLKSLRTDALKREDSSTATNSDSSPANSACNSPSRDFLAKEDYDSSSSQSQQLKGFTPDDTEDDTCDASYGVRQTRSRNCDDSNMDAKSELSQDNVNPTEVRRKKKTFKVHPYKEYRNELLPSGDPRPLEGTFAGHPAPQGKYNFLKDMGDMSRTERIVEYQKRMGDMRQVYLKLKAELAYLDKKKKKLRKRDKDKATELTV